MTNYLASVTHPVNIALEKAGMSQNQLARLCGVSSAAISHVASGKMDAGINLARKIEKHLPITAREIMSYQLDRKLKECK